MLKSSCPRTDVKNEILSCPSFLANDKEHETFREGVVD